MLSGFSNRLSSWFAIALGCLLLNSCFETEQEFTLNPDGTGKMVLNTVFPNIQLNGDEDPTDEALQDAVASTPYNNGVFRPDIRGNSVLAYVTARGEDGRFGRNLGTEISAPPLKDFMLMGYSSFSGDQANRNYALGLLLTHYFFHMEGGGKARRITKFLKGLHAGNKGEAALAPLLDRGDFKKLEKDISSAWRRKGVTIRFGG